MIKVSYALLQQDTDTTFFLFLKRHRNRCRRFIS
nr:MAG TPA: hypothetical protein [Caudoviricetes sp.]